MESTTYSFKRYSESWIEVSSQPSSSSLSSAAADDANPRTLGVQFDQHGRRRRRLLRTVSAEPNVPDRCINALGSSQEEYEESESESDRILTSSNENVEHRLSNGASAKPAALPLADASSSEAAEDDDDDDENATALGATTNAPVFTPPPNAFSHPSQGYAAQRHTRSLESHTSYFPAHRTSPNRRPAAHARHTHSYPSRSSRTGHTPYNMISPSHQADHDAALRASLSTLLSCAAAARGLPKRDGISDSLQRASGTTVAGPSNRIEPSALRLVPASAIPTDPALTEEENQPPKLPSRPHSTTHRQCSANSLSASEKGKRKASSSKERNSNNKSKKQRRANSPIRGELEVQPSLLTWFVGAGVVVLFSAISFTAGYAIGREVGRVEAGRAISEEGVICGREVGKGLRRTLRWSSGTSGLSVIRV